MSLLQMALISPISISYAIQNLNQITEPKLIMMYGEGKHIQGKTAKEN